jgi:hypothetical protein
MSHSTPIDAPRPRRQWGAERRSEPLSIVHPRPSAAKLTWARIGITVTVLAWMGYIVSTVLREFLNSSNGFRFTMEAVSYVIVMTFLTFSALMYLLARQGALQRFRDHERAPRSALDAKLSAQYVLARAMVEREVTLSHFEGDSYRDGEIQEAMKLVHLRPLDDGTLAREGDFFADIAVALTEGGTVTGSIDRPAGHHAGVPLEADKLKAKYEACVRHCLTDEQMGGFYESVRSLEHAGSIRELTDHMVGNQPGRNVP